jgi:hypothetical protein
MVWGKLYRQSFRRLWPVEMRAFRDHLIRLDPESRHARFAMAVSDDFLNQYSERSLALAISSTAISPRARCGRQGNCADSTCPITESDARKPPLAWKSRFSETELVPKLVRRCQESADLDFVYDLPCPKSGHCKIWRASFLRNWNSRHATRTSTCRRPRRFRGGARRWPTRPASPRLRLTRRPDCLPHRARATARARQICRANIIFLISAMALAGFNPFGQALAQFIIV